MTTFITISSDANTNPESKNPEPTNPEFWKRGGKNFDHENECCYLTLPEIRIYKQTQVRKK